MCVCIIIVFLIKTHSRETVTLMYKWLCCIRYRTEVVLLQQIPKREVFDWLSFLFFMHEFYCDNALNIVIVKHVVNYT